MKYRPVIFVFCLMSSLASGSARAQEADVRAAVSETLAALIAGDVPTFASFYHEDTRGFFVDRANMIEGFSALAGCQDEAIWLYAVLSWTGTGGALCPY